MLKMRRVAREICIILRTELIQYGHEQLSDRICTSVKNILDKVRAICNKSMIRATCNKSMTNLIRRSSRSRASYGVIFNIKAF